MTVTLHEIADAVANEAGETRDRKPDKWYQWVRRLAKSAVLHRKPRAGHEPWLFEPIEAQIAVSLWRFKTDTRGSLPTSIARMIADDLRAHGPGSWIPVGEHTDLSVS